MLDIWNRNNPTKRINIDFSNLPYAEMHNNVTMAVQTGRGMPDIVDIEISQFPNFMRGNIAFYPLNRFIEPYRATTVASRIAIYAKDGQEYGVPTNVGATVMFYNVELLEAAGVDYRAIVTWDDFTAAGRQYRQRTGKPITTVDTAGHDWLSVSMAAHREDWTNAAGRANIEIASVRNMLNLQQGWVRDGIAVTSPGGHVDMETGFANILAGGLAAFPKAMWFMSRFVNYMPEMAGKWAIAPLPVFQRGQPRSVGVGGTGTVISKTAKNPELLAEFLCWAKLSRLGNEKIWENLGFDTCNTEIWSDTRITQDRSNKYIAYFRTNPFDTLNAIKNEIGMIRVQQINPTIHEQINTNVLVGVLQDMGNVDALLREAQRLINLEQ